MKDMAKPFALAAALLCTAMAVAQDPPGMPGFQDSVTAWGIALGAIVVLIVAIAIKNQNKRPPGGPDQ